MESDSLRIYTSSQDSMIMSEVRELCISDLDQLFDTPEPLEAKYDISEAMSAPQHQEQQQQQQEPSILPVHFPQLAQMPTSDEFPGQFNFHVVPDEQYDTKSWTYSQKMNKVFIEMDKTLPIRMKWSPYCGRLYIKAVMAFCQPTHRSDPVIRCHNHVASSKQDLHYVLSCKHTNACYEETNGHHSVRVPLGIPQPGSDSVQMDFMFHCKNSCSTGINRRLTEVVFNLEDELGVVLGRRKLLVRICSCPKRDREKEEKPGREKKPVREKEDRQNRESSAQKRLKIAPGKKYMPIYREQPQPELEPEIFTFSARIYGRENVEILRRLTYGLLAETLKRTGQTAAIQPLLDELERMPH